MTQDRAAFDRDVHRAWADHFGCPAERLDQPGTTILAEPTYAGDNLIALWRIGARTFAQIGPQLADAVQRVTDGLPADTTLTADDLTQAWVLRRRRAGAGLPPVLHLGERAAALSLPA